MEKQPSTKSPSTPSRREARVALRDAIYDLGCPSGPWTQAIRDASRVLLSGERTITRRQRLLAIAGPHLALATRLRRTLGGPASPRAALRAHVHQGLGSATGTGEPLAELLAAGAAVLLECFDAEGWRFFVAVRSEATPLVAATFRERQVGGLAASGLSNDEIAFDIGCGSSTVGSHVGRALAQLGLSHRSDLAFIGGEPRTVPLGDLELLVVAARLRSPAQLSRAETQVAQLAVRGRSDRAIAIARGSSPRTVANQLRSVYRKLRVASRTELALALRASATPASGLTRAAS